MRDNLNQTLAISAKRVASDMPEPGSVWMFGLGLLLAGAGVYSRRRNDASVFNG